LLRTMATAMAPRGLRHIKDEIAPNHLLALCGICYRRDSVDKIHTGEPHQMDLWYVTREKQMTDEDLLEMVGVIVDVVCPGAKWKTIPREHPYTLNGIEVNVLWNGKWLELLECGLAHPKVIKQHIGNDSVSGLALGIGLDRALMLVKNIEDIRLFRSTDLRILSQMQDLSPYKEVSSMPPVTRDISLVVDNLLDNEILGDAVRESMGDKANVIESLSILSETPYSALPEKAIKRLGIKDGQKNILLRTVLRSLEKTLTNQECNEYRDTIYKALYQGDVMELACTPA